jgi:hypothetical protein
MNIYGCVIFLIHKQKLPGDKRREERTKIKTTKSNALNLNIFLLHHSSWCTRLCSGARASALPVHTRGQTRGPVQSSNTSK